MLVAHEPSLPPSLQIPPACCARQLVTASVLHELLAAAPAVFEIDYGMQMHSFAAIHPVRRISTLQRSKRHPSGKVSAATLTALLLR